MLSRRRMRRASIGPGFDARQLGVTHSSRTVVAHASLSSVPGLGKTAQEIRPGFKKAGSTGPSRSVPASRVQGVKSVRERLAIGSAEHDRTAVGEDQDSIPMRPRAKSSNGVDSDHFAAMDLDKVLRTQSPGQRSQALADQVRPSFHIDTNVFVGCLEA